jgi:AcrR family transcriptional regulator
MTQARKKPAPPPAELEDWRKAATRSEKAELLREALFRAAAEVVGEVGYADASVSLITARAGVGQGTFYNYFASRQDLFDQLLPTLGRQMRQHVRAQARAGTNFAEREGLSFRAFFSFLAQTPHFFRILNEAESFAPNAHKLHFESVAGGYMDFLRRGLEDGEFPGFEPREIEVVTYILMAARSYLAWRYVYGEERQTDIPEWVARAYDKFVLYGLKGQPRPQAVQPEQTAPRPPSAIPTK